jgi:hypothetical protein
VVLPFSGARPRYVVLKVPSGRRVAVYPPSAGSQAAEAGQAATAPRVFPTSSFTERLGLAVVVALAVRVASRAIENNMIAGEKTGRSKIRMSDESLM